MKKARLILSASLLTVGTFAAITFTSCSKDEVCPVGYTGKDCKTLVRDQFIGVYVGTEQCTIGTDQYTVTIVANSDNVKVTMTNIYNDNYTAIGTVTGDNTISFSGSQSGATFSVTGTIAGTQLTLDYTVSDALSSNTCKFVGTK